VDATSIDGVECTDPPGEDDIGGPVLIPAADQTTMPPLAGKGFQEILKERRMEKFELIDGGWVVDPSAPSIARGAKAPNPRLRFATP
jgi:hypothetical protein